MVIYLSSPLPLVSYSFSFCWYNNLVDAQGMNRSFEELSFSRLIVVPLFFIDFVGVRKENERLTAILSSLPSFLNSIFL